MPINSIKNTERISIEPTFSSSINHNFITLLQMVVHIGKIFDLLYEHASKINL